MVLASITAGCLSLEVVKAKTAWEWYDAVLGRNRLNANFSENDAASIGPEYGAISPIHTVFLIISLLRLTLQIEHCATHFSKCVRSWRL